jgi:phenylalanyl-tRNA synthetase beta chain
MIFSYKWIKEFVETTLSPEELSEKLTMAGVEVEATEELAKGLTGVVTAEIVSKEKHPNADRLSLCEVKTDKESYSIVCGAKNMVPGDKVALGLIGATLPGGVKLKRSKIRGVESEGMMCSEVELGIADTSEGITVLPKDTALGVDIKEALGLDDTLLDVCITPNRADCLSVRGLSREAAAISGAVFVDNKINIKEAGASIDELISIKLDAPDIARRYTARVIEGVRIAPSPEWLSRRLEAHGIRSINNVVDATNYVLLEYGQPLHAFDLDKIQGSELTVRLAKDGEKITTIDDVERELDAEMLVIADSQGPTALAGVMGGKRSEVTEATTRLLLESAYFTPETVRRTSRKTGLSSDSSYRFERGVDIEGVGLALDRVAALIVNISGGEIRKGLIDLYPEKYVPCPIEFSLEHAENLLGISVDEEWAAETLKRLGMEVVAESKGVLIVTPPSYRTDVTLTVDITEELARIKGYDAIPAQMPSAELTSINRADNKNTEVKKSIKEKLVSAGFFEVINYSFIDEDSARLLLPEGAEPIFISNPLSKEQGVMRTSLIPSLLSTFEYNLARKNTELSIFELRAAYYRVKGAKAGSSPVERWLVSGLMSGVRGGRSWLNQAQGGREFLDFFDLKGVVESLISGLGISTSGDQATQGNPGLSSSESALEYSVLKDTSALKILHPGKAANISLNGESLGLLGELHPNIAEKMGLKNPPVLFELSVDVISDALEKTGARNFKPLSRYPTSERDVAFTIDTKFSYADVKKEISLIKTKVIEKIELFDVYYGENVPKGERSLALRVVYRSAVGTLTNEEVDAAHEEVTGCLTKSFNARLRV